MKPSYTQKLALSAVAFTYIASIMVHSELCTLVRGCPIHRSIVIPTIIRADLLTLVVSPVHLCSQSAVCCPWKPTLFINESQESSGLPKKQFNYGPVAVVIKGLRGNALSSTLLLLPFEDVFIEEVLQLLIGYVDTHLNG